MSRFCVIDADNEAFWVRLKGSTWAVTYYFPMDYVTNGGSVSRAMNLKVRETVKNASKGWCPPVAELKTTANNTVPVLREYIEKYLLEQE